MKDALILCLPIIVLAFTNLSQSKRINDTRTQVHELRTQLWELRHELARGNSMTFAPIRSHDAMSPSTDDQRKTK